MVYRNAHILFTGIFLVICSAVLAQDQKVADSLSIIYQGDTVSDTAKFELLTDLSFNETRDLAKGLQYADELINLSEKIGKTKYLRIGYFLKGNKQRAQGKLDEALGSYLKSAEIARRLHNLNGEAETYGAIGDSYSEANDHPNAKLFYNKSIAILRKCNDSISLASVLSNAGNELFKTRNFDSALLDFNEAKIIFDKINYLSGKGYTLGNIGMVYAEIGKNDLAEKNINEAIRIHEEAQNYSPICDYLISMSILYSNKENEQNAINYALKSLGLAQQYGLKSQVATANLKLSELYEKTGDIAQSFKHYKNYIAYRDSVNNIKSVQKMANQRIDYEISQKQIEVNLLSQQKRNQKNLLISLGIILFMTIIIVGILFKNNQNRQKAYRILKEQRQETEKQKTKAEDALNELKVTQKQLIQSAKMASLGELTAGIAHEIQNPLNFVNNFSEVGVELLGELKEITANKLTVPDKAQADEIIKDLTDNLTKISHHGKRADSIVKGMLEHSRTSVSKIEPTDLNALSEKYLSLSYHGLRAKDNTFNVFIETSFDNSIKELSIIPQDIGRVLLNIYNNAFYSIHQKTKLTIEGYEPKLWLTTKGIVKDHKLIAVQIHIKDNGMGIPDNILNKIYQPFFTTKPTGQGTGLGLSLSYDIIKAHEGDIKVNTKEGEGAEFIIQLPIA